MLYKVTYFGNAVNYGSEQFFMCPMFVTECFHNKCLNCQPCVQFIFSPGCESDMILSVMTLICPIERVIGVKGALLSKSLQPNQMEVQDHPKWTVRSLKPRLHHPCQVGRHRWTTLKCLSLETYKILNMLIRDKSRSAR